MFLASGQSKRIFHRLHWLDKPLVGGPGFFRPHQFYVPSCCWLHDSINLSPTINKQLLDEVFVISRIIKVEVRVISRSRRLRLITLTETLIILDITKTESNNCFIIH